MIKRALRMDYAGPAGKPVGLADGSVRIPAYISRTGVQVYEYDDGSQVREYRPPEEVFATDSLESFRGLALTVDHPEEPVSPDNWSRHGVGHVADNARKDGPYLAVDVIVKDRETLKKIASGELVELSCGYFADIEEKPGISPEGEPYDVIQHSIIGNHVALGPVDWGRAGNNVKLYAGDSKKYGRTAIGYHVPGNATEPNQAGAPMPVRKDAVTEPTTEPKPTTEPAPAPVAPSTPVAPVVPETEAPAPETPAPLQTPAVAAAADSAESLRVRILAVKADAKHASIAGDSKKTDRDVMLAVIKDWKPSFNADGRSDDYVRSAFDLACEESPTKATTRDDSRAAAALAPTAIVREDGENDPLVIAHRNMISNLSSLARNKA